MDKELQIKMYAFTMDCSDPHELAEFYTKLLGWDIPYQDENYVVIAPPDVSQGAYPGITFQRNPEYQPPVWPSKPEAQQQMAHLDLAVNDLEKAVKSAVEYGAVVADEQFSDGWRVMKDPAGHPFCLCLMPHVFTASE